MVVWKRDLYIQEANRQLSDNRFYQRLHADPIQQDQKNVKTTIRDMIASCKLPPTAKHLVVTTPRTSRFYMLPKIHKPDNPGRPIVSACCCPTENISAYLDEVMAPFVKQLPTYVKDTNHALRIFDSFTFDASDQRPCFFFHHGRQIAVYCHPQRWRITGSLLFPSPTDYQGTFYTHLGSPGGAGIDPQCLFF